MAHKNLPIVGDGVCDLCDSAELVVRYPSRTRVSGILMEICAECLSNSLAGILIEGGRRSGSQQS